MEHALQVRRAQRLADVAHDRGRELQVESRWPDRRPQRHTLDELHHEERPAIRGPIAIDHPDHPGMVDAGQRFRFLQELPGQPRVLRRVVEQELDDDRHVVQPEVAREVDDTDAAPTELALDADTGR